MDVMKKKKEEDYPHQKADKRKQFEEAIKESRLRKEKEKVRKIVGGSI